MRTVGIWAASLLVGVASTGCGGNRPAALSDADRTAIQKSQVTDAMAAMNAKDFASYANLFTEDVALLPPNGPTVNGRAAMLTFLEGFPAYSDMTLGLVTIQGSGDAAYVHGTYSMMITPPGASAPVADHGKWVVGARKQADGSWKGTVVIFNSDLAATAPPTPAK